MFIAILLSVLLLASLIFFFIAFKNMKNHDFRIYAQNLLKLEPAEAQLFSNFLKKHLPLRQNAKMLNDLNVLKNILLKFTNENNKATSPLKEIGVALRNKLLQRCAQLDQQTKKIAGVFNSTKDLPLGAEVELFIKESKGKSYTSWVLEQDKQGLIISYPSSLGKLPSSWRASPVLISLNHDNHGSYRFASEFDREYFDRHFSSLRLLHSNSFIFNQRRQQQRHKVHLRAWVSVNPDLPKQHWKAAAQSGEVVPVSEQPLLPCSIVNLSSKGLGMVFDEKIYCHSKVNINTQLFGSRLNIKGRICSYSYQAQTQQTAVGVEITHLEKESEQQLYTFLYGPQKEEVDG